MTYTDTTLEAAASVPDTETQPPISLSYLRTEGNLSCNDVNSLKHLQQAH